MIAAEFGAPCSPPFSRSTRAVIIDDEPQRPIMPPEALKATQIANAIGSTTSVLTALGATQVAQSSRAHSLAQIISCSEAIAPQKGSLSWTDSPTQLAIGDSDLRYDLGAVIGNWAMLGAVTLGWSAIAVKFGSEATRYPGGLVLPVLFLAAPTTTSSVSLMRDGTFTQQLIGGCSVTAQVLGTGLVALILHPTYFRAQWVTEPPHSDWIDQGEAGYVKHFGMLFEDYQGKRQLFMAAELLMSTATGIIRSYMATGKNCKEIVTATAAVYLGYALSVGLLKPNAHPKDRIFYTAIAGLQSLAFTIQAVSLWTASKETTEKTQFVGESIIMTTEWALLAKSIYDIGQRAFSALQHIFWPDENKHQRFELPTAHGDQELLERPLLAMPEVDLPSAPAPVPPPHTIVDISPDITPTETAPTLVTPAPTPRVSPVTQAPNSFFGPNPHNLNPLDVMTVEQRASIL